MSKRKKRNPSANSPQASVERAQEQAQQVTNEIAEQAAVTAEQVTDTVEETSAEAVFKAKPAGVTPLTPPVRRVRAVRRDMAPARVGNNRNNTPQKDPKTDTSYIRSRLANPTRFVTEAELRAEYGYVIKDLRIMGALAGALIVVLFVLERVL